MHMQCWKHTGPIWILTATKTSTGFISDKEPYIRAPTENALGLCRSPDLLRVTHGHHTCSCWWCKLKPPFSLQCSFYLVGKQKPAGTAEPSNWWIVQSLWLELWSLWRHQYTAVIFSWGAISTDVTRIISRRANCSNLWGAFCDSPFLGETLAYHSPWQTTLYLGISYNI